MLDIGKKYRRISVMFPALKHKSFKEFMGIVALSQKRVTCSSTKISLGLSYILVKRKELESGLMKCDE